MVGATCDYVLVSQGVKFQVKFDNKFLRISVTKNRSEYNARRIFCRVRD